MSTFLLVHGAFRGSWAFGEVPNRLVAAGHDVVAPTLRGMGPDVDRRRSPTPTLSDWVSDVAEMCAPHPGKVVAVGHSQGGLVVAALAERHPELVSQVVFLDAPVPGPGARGVDLGGRVPSDAELPSPDTWLDPLPLGPESGLTAELAAWVTERLVPTPLAPSLEIAIRSPLEVPCRYVFCAQTPPSFPSALTRASFDRNGVSYEVIDAPHDVALVDPDLVVVTLVDGVAVSR